MPLTVLIAVRSALAVFESCGFHPLLLQIVLADTVEAGDQLFLDGYTSASVRRTDPELAAANGLGLTSMSSGPRYAWLIVVSPMLHL